MAVTIKDVAQRAGVSHPTVSRALRGDRSVTPETTTRIRQIAHELGYIPSAAARSLKTNRTRVVGVLVHRVSDPFYSQVLEGVQDTLQAEAYSIFLASTNNDRARQIEILRAMRERRVDGLIVCSPFITAEDRRQIQLHGVPLVLIHNRAAEILPYTIYHDDRYGARRMTRHLIELGHTRIAYMGNARAGRVSNERLAGFKQEMHAAGLHVPDSYIVHAASAQSPAAREPTQSLLALDVPPTALFCFDDVLAIGAMHVLHEANFQVPRDWSVAGFDDIALAEFVNPPLTTFNQPKYTLGTQAAQLLLESMDESQPNDNASHVVTLRGEILIRASTAPPKG
ncbi:MAG TPA: LacI family DNA-binding transcriptional regulator [Anaerolineae bacterium]|nr:LacI family DNA-binding transcriptional regulator [Anaerolineae bacterium]